VAVNYYGYNVGATYFRNFTIYDGKGVNVATFTGSTKAFSTSGSITAAGNVTANSDERLKKDWVPVRHDFIEHLAVVKSGTYTRADSGERQAGSSAQDWQRLLPEVVAEAADEDKTLSLAYGNAALVSAVELAKRIVEQEQRIKRLESLINKLLGNQK